MPGERALIALVGLCFMLQPLATDAYLPSLPGLARTFDAGIATVQLTLSLFVLTFGALQLVAGPLSDRFGRHPLLVGGLALYVVASLACALAPTLGSLIVARVFQAAGCCTCLAVARAIVRDVFTPQAGARAIAQASSILAAAPLLGPILGGALEVRFGFRAIFVVLAIFAGGLLVLTLRDSPKPTGISTRTRRVRARSRAPTDTCCAPPRFSRTRSPAPRRTAASSRSSPVRRSC